MVKEVRRINKRVRVKKLIPPQLTVKREEGVAKRMRRVKIKNMSPERLVYRVIFAFGEDTGDK